MPEFFKSLDTKSVRAGEPSPRVGGAIVTPIFQTAMFERGDETGYDAIPYIRLNNTPNQIAVAAKLRSLENAEAAVVTASGMAAISTALLTFLSAGDHLLVQDCLYGGTHYLVTDDFAAFGIEFDDHHFDGMQGLGCVGRGDDVHCGFGDDGALGVVEWCEAGLVFGAEIDAVDRGGFGDALEDRCAEETC